MNEMNELDNKIAELKQLREELTKGAPLFSGSGAQQAKGFGSIISGGSSTPPTPVSKMDEDHEDEKKDKKMIEEKMDEHNEKKHGEAKDEDTAMDKAEINNKKAKQVVSPSVGIGKVGDKENKPSKVKTFKPGDPGFKERAEEVKFAKNGQWSMAKTTMAPKPNGKLDVPVKDVYNGDDHTKEIGGKSVDGDKGKTIKIDKNP